MVTYPRYTGSVKHIVYLKDTASEIKNKNQRNSQRPMKEITYALCATISLILRVVCSCVIC